MNRAAVAADVRSHIVTELLEGDDEGLQDTTPLIELGVLNSIEILRLVIFLEDRFHIEVPPDVVVMSNLKDIGSITDLVTRLSA